MFYLVVSVLLLLVLFFLYPICRFVCKVTRMSDDLAAIFEGLVDKQAAPEGVGVPPAPVSGGVGTTEMREKLAQLVASGQSKSLLGRKFSALEIEKMGDTLVIKYYRVYEVAWSALINKEVVHNIIQYSARLIGYLFPIDDMGQYTTELQEDFHVVNGCRTLSGYFAHQFAPLYSIISAGVITASNIDYGRVGRDKGSSSGGGTTDRSTGRKSDRKNHPSDEDKIPWAGSVGEEAGGTIHPKEEREETSSGDQR